MADTLEKSSFGEKGSAFYRSINFTGSQGSASGLLTIYFKLHASGEQNSTLQGRQMFVTGLPLNMEGETLGRLLAIFGDAETVVVHRTGKSALVVFASAASCKAMVVASEKGTALRAEPSQHSSQFGLKGWVEEHKAQFPGNELLERQIDEWTEEHEAAEESKKVASQATVDDGWTLVTRKRGRKNTAALAAQAVPDPKKAPKQLPDFYSFQKKDHRQNEVVELRKKFEEDKKKIANLRAARRFKPY